MPDKCEYISGLNGTQADGAIVKSVSEEMCCDGAMVLNRAWSQRALSLQVFSIPINNPILRRLRNLLSGNEPSFCKDFENPT